MQPSSGSLPRRIPSLDGLRGLSITAVIMSHAATHFAGNSRGLMRAMHPLADYGVNVFFVISGFLITTILMRTRQADGHVSLGRFYRRRAIRILPVSLVYIAIISLLAHPSWIQILYALTFTTSLVFTKAYSGLQQLWSLSVEEQFYLFWPFAFLLPERITRRVAVGVVIAVPVLRVTLRALGYRQFWHAGPAIADTLMAGCLLALYREPVTAFVRRRLCRPAAFLAVWGASLAMQFVYRGGYATCVLWFTLPMLIALGIAAAMERQDLVLNRGPLVWIGLLSYSLYLWQQPFFVFGGPWDHVMPRLLLVFATACVSYKLVEQPALRLAQRRKETVAVTSA